MKYLRLAIASFLAPATIPAIYYVLMRVFSGYPISGEEHLSKLFYEAFFAILPMSYFVSLLFGAPTLIALHMLGRLNAKNCIYFAGIIGTLIGITIGYAASWKIHGGIDAITMILTMLLGVFSASCVATVFCLIAQLSSLQGPVTSPMSIIHLFIPSCPDALGFGIILEEAAMEFNAHRNDKAWLSAPYLVGCLALLALLCMFVFVGYLQLHSAAIPSLADGKTILLKGYGGTNFYVSRAEAFTLAVLGLTGIALGGFSHYLRKRVTQHLKNIFIVWPEIASATAIASYWPPTTCHPFPSPSPQPSAEAWQPLMAIATFLQVGLQILHQSGQLKLSGAADLSSNSPTFSMWNFPLVT